MIGVGGIGLFYFNILLISVLLIDTLFLGNVFSLQWHSPKMMYLISAYLVPVKFLLTVLALALLRRTVLSGWRNLVRHTMSGLAVIQLVLMSLVGVGYIFAGFAPLSEQFRVQGNIAVYTADPGAMGRAYHYFSYFCRNDFGFYRLTPIGRLDWLGDFTISEQQAELVITPLRNNTDAVRLSLIGYSC